MQKFTFHCKLYQPLNFPKRPDSWKIQIDNMQYSAEMRWFPDYETCTRSILPWFNTHGKSFKGNSRSDLYLATKNLPTHGIKLRDGRLEIKVLHHDWGEIAINDKNRGRANMWCKYAFNMNPEDAEPGEIVSAFTGSRSIGINQDWILFNKERLQVTYAINAGKATIELAGENDLTEQGCHLELTRIKVNFQKDYYTFALEAFGKGINLKQYLDMAISEVLLTNKISGLCSEWSMSYPEFLGRLEGK